MVRNPLTHALPLPPLLVSLPPPAVPVGGRPPANPTTALRGSAPRPRRARETLRAATSNRLTMSHVC